MSNRKQLKWQPVERPAPAYLKLYALQKLARWRYGLQLPNDNHGRAMLKALLAVGADTARAKQWCPWLRRGELQEIINGVDIFPPEHWSGNRLGNAVELTDDEREELRLWPLMPSDVDWHVVQERVAQRRRERDRARRRGQRERIKMARNEPMRDESLLFLILPGRWVCAGKLPDMIKGAVAWRNQKNGEPITGESLRKLVYQALDNLETRGLIKSKYCGAVLSFAGRRYVSRKRLTIPQSLVFPSGKTHVRARSADGMDTSNDVA